VIAKIYSHEELIGTTELKVGDESMGCVYGDIIPTDAYYKTIQKNVWEFWATNKPDYKKWYSLRLNVQLENGYFLFPAGGYTISDLQELPNEPKRIDIAGLDRHVMEDFFLQETPRPFLEEPWYQIDIKQKIGLEDELSEEIGLTEKSLFGFFKNSSKHFLAEYEFSALATYRCNDDVLFAVRKNGFDKNFAVIHLTWKGKKEVDNFPATDFFTDFDEFKLARMYPDKAEWED
jgi:hypothetical protein